MPLSAQDITAIKEALAPEFGSLRQEMDTLGTGLRQEMDALGTGLRQEMEQLNQQTITDLSGVINDGFTMAGERFDTIDKRLEIIEGDLKALKNLVSVHSVEIMELKARPI
jgi:predicted DNA binding CopG/RHH family protein